MNVDVLNRSGLQPAGAVEARDRRLRRASAPGRRRHRRGQQVALSLPVEALAGACGDVRRPLSPALGEGVRLSEGPAAGVPPRRLAERRESRQRSGLHGRAAPRSEQRGARHPQSADQRTGRAGRRSVRCPDARHQRVAGRRVDLPRCAAEGLRRGAVRGRPDLGQDDRGARRRREFRPGAAADPHRRAARPAALLADLSGGGRGQPADRHPRLRLWRQRDDLRRLAVLLHRGDGRSRAVPAGGADQPDLRGRVRALPDAEGGAGRGRLRLGARACLADGPAVRQAAPRGAASEAPAVGVHAEQRLVHHPAGGGAGAARAPGGCDRVDGLGSRAVRDRLSALGLRRSRPGAADPDDRDAAAPDLPGQRNGGVRHAASDLARRAHSSPSPCGRGLGGGVADPKCCGWTSSAFPVRASSKSAALHSRRPTSICSASASRTSQAPPPRTLPPSRRSTRATRGIRMCAACRNCAPPWRII